MRELLFTSEQRQRTLEGGIEKAVKKIEALQKVVAEELPGVVWCNNFIWALAQYPDIKTHYYEKIMRSKAAQRKLNCDFGATLVSEDVRLNRKIVELETRPALETIYGFLKLSAVHEYLRAGIITIARKGTVDVAPDARERIAQFCSVYIESAQEKAFVGNLRALQEAAKKAEKLHGDFAASVKAPGGRDAVTQCVRYYMADRFELVPGLRLMSPGMIWCAFIAFCTRIRKGDAPHFYNKAGAPDISVTELYQLTGYKPAATPELRIKFPELYKGVPYRNFIGSSIWDDADGMKQIREKLKKGCLSIDSHGRLIYPRDDRFTPFVVEFLQDNLI